MKAITVIERDDGSVTVAAGDLVSNAKELIRLLHRGMEAVVVSEGLVKEVRGNGDS